MHTGGTKSFFTGALGLLALTFALFFDVLFLPGDAVLSNGRTDLVAQFVHWRGFGFGEIARGNLPLWNPHIYCGAPFLAGFQSALLYPLNAVYLILPLAKAINWGIALHAFLGGLFTWLWMYRRGLHPLACFLAGAEFILCAPHFLHIYAGHLPNLCTMIWAPLLFLAIDGTLEKPAAGWCLLGSLAIAMQILAGHVQYAYYTGIAASIYLVLSLPRASRRPQSIACVFLFYAGGAVLAAAQILPGLEAGMDTLRSLGVPYEFAAMFSLPPENLLTLVAPFFFGDMVRFPYWGRWYLWEMSLFVSVTGFLLALYAVVFRKGGERVIAAVAAGILLLLAMGSYMPWFPFLQSWLPGFSLFRGVSKFVFQASLFVILLSAMGLDSLVREGLQKRRYVLSILGIAAALALATGLAILQSAGAPSGTWAEVMRAMQAAGGVYLPPDFYGNSLAIAKAGEFAAMNLIVLAVVCAVLSAVLFLRLTNIQKTSLLVCLAVFELVFSGFAVRDTFKLADAWPAGMVTLLRQRAGENRLLNPYNPNLAMTTGWRDIWGYDPLIPRRYGEFTAWVQQADMMQVVSNGVRFRYHPLLKMLGCRYMIGPSGNGIVLTDLGDDIMPRATLVGQWVVEPERDRTFAILGKPGYDPRSLVVLERDPKLTAGPDSTSLGTVRLTDASTDHLTFEADVRTAAILVVTDNYANGWRIFSAEGSASDAYEIIPANYTLRGVPLTAGYHSFRMVYRPVSFVVGCWLSLAGIIVWLAVAVALLRRRCTDIVTDRSHGDAKSQVQTWQS